MVNTEWEALPQQRRMFDGLSHEIVAGEDTVGFVFDAKDARLIAAAPELFDAASNALQYIVVAYRDGKENGLSEETLAIAERDHKRLVAALARARGDAEGGAS